MAQGFPCINPTCDYTFSFAEIQGATALACPRCGNICQLATTITVPSNSSGDSPTTNSVISPATPNSPLSAYESPPLPKLATSQQATVSFPPPSASLLYTPPASTPTLTYAPAPVNPPIAARVAPPVAEKIPPVEQNIFAGPDAFTSAGSEMASTVTHVATAEPSPFANNDILSSATLERKKQPAMPLPQRILLVVALGLLLLGLPLVAILSLFNFLNPTWDESYADVYNGYLYTQENSKAIAFRLLLPLETWKANKGFRDMLKAAIAVESEQVDEESGKKVLMMLAVAGQDYGKQKPRDAELLKQAITRLERCFGERLNVDTTPEITELEGKRALALSFQGELNSVDWVGRCYALTHHGFGYWVFVAQTIPIGVDQELSVKVLAELQNNNKYGFRLKTKRQGWTEQPPEMTSHTSDDESVTIKVPKGIWLMFPPRDYDPQGEIFLNSKDKHKYHKDNEKEATILVLKLKKKTANLEEALKAGQDYVEQKKKEENETFKISLITEKPAAAKEKNDKENEPKTQEKKAIQMVGNQPGKILELQMESDDISYKKYILLAVVRKPDHIYLLQCESFWKYRQAWRGDFLDILNTFTLSQAKKIEED